MGATTVLLALAEGGARGRRACTVRARPAKATARRSALRWNPAAAAAWRASSTIRPSSHRRAGPLPRRPPRPG